MASYGLKTNITVQMGLILIFGMGLTAFMTTNVIEHVLIRSHISKARLHLSVLKSDYGNHVSGMDHASRTLFDDSPDDMNALVLDRATGQTRLYGLASDYTKDMRSYANDAILSGKDMEISFGSVWGVFWKQKMAVIIACPLETKDGHRLGAAIFVPLSKVYHDIRHAQRLIFLYVMINGVLLTLAGLHQVAKRVVKPIQRLLKRAEDYHGEHKNLIFDERSGNEFNKLSSALNNMLGRISEDKVKLSETVVSLEKTNHELKKAQADIVRAEKLASVGRLSSGIAHEIGNPLGIVSGYLELMKPQATDEDVRQDYIKRAERELARIDRIIRQLLDYSRTSTPTMAYFSAHETLNEVAEMLSIQPMMAGVDIDLKLSANKDRVKGDADQFKQVLMNLSLNALDAMVLNTDSSKGALIFETANIPAGEGGGLLNVSVLDNGTGMAKETLDTIFDPFFTTKEPGKGTGLGLSVCYTIIQDLGGRIVVDSDEGKGTRVDMFFPLPKSKDNEHILRGRT